MIPVILSCMLGCFRVALLVIFIPSYLKSFHGSNYVDLYLHLQFSLRLLFCSFILFQTSRISRMTRGRPNCSPSSGNSLEEFKFR